MSTPRKSPREKKDLEFKKDHFTFAKSQHGFRKAWPLKKALANREYRRKSEELLSQAKSGNSLEDVDLVAGELTAGQVRNAISRKRLQKWGTVSVGEKIRVKLEKRSATVGRRAKKHRKYDAIVTSAVLTLNSLEGKALADAVKCIALLLQSGDPLEWARLYESTDPLDRAIFFVERLARRDSDYLNALCRNKKLCESFQRWKRKANRVYDKAGRPQQRKIEQKVANERKVKALRREAQRATQP